MERRQVLDTLRRAEVLREQLERLDECLEELEPEEQEVLEILLEDDEKMVRICDALDVSQATAYRVKDRVLGKLSQLFLDKQVRIS